MRTEITRSLTPVLLATAVALPLAGCAGMQAFKASPELIAATNQLRSLKSDYMTRCAGSDAATPACEQLAAQVQDSKARHASILSAEKDREDRHTEDKRGNLMAMSALISGMSALSGAISKVPTPSMAPSAMALMNSSNDAQTSELAEYEDHEPDALVADTGAFSPGPDSLGGGPSGLGGQPFAPPGAGLSGGSGAPFDDPRSGERSGTSGQGSGYGSSQVAAGASGCPTTLRHIEPQLPYYNHPELIKAREVAMNADVADTMRKAQAMGYSPRQAAAETLKQALAFDANLPQTYASMKGTMMNFPSKEDLESGRANLGSERMMGGAAAHAYVMQYYGSVTNKAMAAGLACLANSVG